MCGDSNGYRLCAIISEYGYMKGLIKTDLVLAKKFNEIRSFNTK